MDWDDPEKRIAELEGLQAGANAAAGRPVAGGAMSAAGGELTADDVHNVAFSAASGGKRGYDVGDVEAFRRRLEEQLRNPRAVGGLTAAEVDSVAFSKPAIGKGGYDQHEVDAFLERALQRLKPDVGSQPGFPPASGGFRDYTGKRSKPRRFDMLFVFLAIVAAVHSLVTFGIGVYDVYGYLVGTPTTAKVVSCTARNKHSSVTCSGQWSVGGKSYAGRIAGDLKGHHAGSSVDVRVRGGSAYTATAGNIWFIIGTSMGVVAVGCALGARRRPTGAAPTAGRHSRN